MSVPHFDTLDSAPLGSLPVPLAPDTVLVPATPGSQGENTSSNDHNRTPDHTQPSPDCTSFYADGIARVPYQIELEEALTTSDISMMPPTFGNENEQEYMADMYNFLTIIARLSADQKSLSDSSLKGIAVIDEILSNFVDEIASQQAANTRAVTDVVGSANALDGRICKEIQTTQGL